MKMSESNYDFESGDLAEKARLLKEKLGVKEAEPQSEPVPTPEEKITNAEPESGFVQQESNDIKGSDVNWDEYELDPNYKHLYPKAVLRAVEGVPKWVATIPEFKTNSKSYSADESRMDKNGEPANLGTYLTWMSNSSEGWKIVSILSNGTGLGAVVFQRMVSILLPDPQMVQTETEVPKQTDEELAEMEKSGLEWAGQPDKSFVDEADVAADALAGEDFGDVSTEGAVEGRDVEL
jgi:hypothetical protein